MAKDNEYHYKHKHIAMKYGHATFIGDTEPSKELLEALNKMAELAYEQCGRLKVDTGENNALLRLVYGKAGLKATTYRTSKILISSTKIAN